MKKLLLLVAVVAMVLPGCQKINDALDELDGRLDKLEQEAIPAIDEQIAAINVSLDALDSMGKELKGYIDGLTATASNLQEQINNTNTKIGEVKATLQGEISTAKAAVLAQLDAVKTELEGELVQINSTIAILQAKDEELDGKIADLKTYVDTELDNTTDWVNATFATLEQYNGLVQEIATIKEQIKAINESITNLETKLTTKINEDIATAVSTLSADIQQKVKEITDAYTAMITSTREGITAAYTIAIQTAINALDASLKAWVGEQLANYYTIAEVDALLATLAQEMNGKLEAQRAYLEGLINELSATTAKSIADNKALIDALRSDVTSLQGENAEHATKIAENATAIAENAQAIIDNAAAIAQNGENIEANEKLIASNKALIDANTKAIAENKSAIEALEVSTGALVAQNAAAIAKNAENIAKNTTIISQNATAITHNQLAISQNATDIAQLQQDLATTKSEITEAYKKAISDAINTNNGVIDSKIAGEVATINTRIDNEVVTINNAINALTARVTTLENEVAAIKLQIAKILSGIADMKEDIANLLARIQSVSYIPVYSDGKATMIYNDNVSRMTLDFEVSPKDAVVELAKVWQSAVSLKAVYTQTRAVTFVDMPITSCEIDATNGVITIVASGENLSEAFFAGTKEASVCLAISDGNNSITSDYVPMVATEGLTGAIYTVADLKSIALDPALTPTVELMATLDMSGEDWTPIDNFSGTFNGNNFEIKNLSSPLFSNLKGEVKNLKVSANITDSTLKQIGALATVISGGGVIENCEVSGRIDISPVTTETQNYYIAAVVGSAQHRAIISNVVNNCSVTVNTSADVRGSVRVAGIAGYVGGSSSSSPTFTNCANNGTLSFLGKTTNSVWMGSLAGMVSMGTYPSITVNGFTNTGDVVFAGECTLAYVGGVFGEVYGSNSIAFADGYEVKNSGEIYNYYTYQNPNFPYRIEKVYCKHSGTLYVGGIIGRDNTTDGHSGNLVNYGDLHIESGGNNSNNGYIGGVCGWMKGTLRGAKCSCTVSGWGYDKVGMITGVSRTDTVKATNCQVAGSIDKGKDGPHYDEEADETKTGWYSSPVLLAADNFHNYIYSATVDASVAFADACVFYVETLP